MVGLENHEQRGLDHEPDEESATSESREISGDTTSELIESPVVESAVVEWPVVGSEAVEPLMILPEGIAPGDDRGEGPEPGAKTSPAPVFGITDAIRIMRSLPAGPAQDDDSNERVASVMSRTLGALGVNVDDILEQARGKEEALSQAIEELRSQAEDLQRHIYERRCEIVAQQTELDEIVRVRGQLSRATHQIPRPPPIPPEALQIRQGRLWNGRVSGSTTAAGVRHEGNRGRRA